MSAVESALIKGRGRDEALKYRLRKYYRIKTRHSGKSKDSHAGVLLANEKQDAYLSRTIDWLGRSANRDQKAKAKAREFLEKEVLNNGHTVVVVAPEFFPTAQNISKIRKSQNENKK